MDPFLTKITDYRNTAGELFSIFVRNIPVKEPSTFWGFQYVVIDSRGFTHTFTGAVNKKHAQTQELAIDFAKDKLLADLKELLESTANGVTPLSFPLNNDWFVI